MSKLCGAELLARVSLSLVSRVENKQQNTCMNSLFCLPLSSCFSVSDRVYLLTELLSPWADVEQL